MQHWIQFILLIVALAAICWAVRQDNDYYDGEFLLAILAFAGGVLLIVVAATWFFVDRIFFGV